MPYSASTAAKNPLARASKLPTGSEALRFPRWKGFWGNALQTFAALVFASYFFFFPGACFVVLFLYKFGLLPCWLLYFGCGIYIVQLVVAGVTGKPHRDKGWPWAFRLFMYRSPFCEWVLRYYDSTVVREGPPLDPSKRYLFAVFPHGVYGVCRAFSGGSGCFCRLFPGIESRWGAFSAGFYVPGVREFSLLAGCLDASRPVLEKAIQRGENIMLLPGGIDEMGLTDGASNVTKLVLTDRKGFTKLALRTGCSIVPAFCFGEKWLHDAVQPPHWLRQLLYRLFRVSGTIPKGRGPTFLGKLDVPMGLVWGEPIVIERAHDPVDEELLRATHCRVQAAIQGIFDRHKASFGYGPEETLEFVSVREARKVV